MRDRDRLPNEIRNLITKKMKQSEKPMMEAKLDDSEAAYAKVERNMTRVIELGYELLSRDEEDDELMTLIEQTEEFREGIRAEMERLYHPEDMIVEERVR